MVGAWCGLKPPMPRVAPAALYASQEGFKTARVGGAKPHSPFIAGFAHSYKGLAASEREIHTGSEDL